MSGPSQFRLTSSTLFHMPSMMKFAQNAFRSPDEKDREVALTMLVDGYGLPRFVAWGLLDGCFPYEVEGECVVFEVDTAPGVQSEARGV